jgi:3-hydroxyisobutyrate dehydrogenase
VIGSRPQAEAGQLIYLAGGEKDTFDQVIPILAHMSSSAHHTGPVGSAGTVKLVINAMLAIQVAGVAELLAILGRSDLDVHRAVEVISSTTVISPAAKVALGAMMASNFNPMFPISLVDKDRWQG